MEPTVKEISTYSLRTTNRRHIRQATQVVFTDGRRVRFLERLGKQAATRQAIAVLKRQEAGA